MTSLEFLRSFRVYKIAVFDLILSYFGIYLLSPLLIKLFKKLNIKTSKTQLLWLTLPLSIVIHLLVGQETPLTKMVLDQHDYYLVKIIILAMIFMAFKKKLRTKKQ